MCGRPTRAHSPPTPPSSAPWIPAFFRAILLQGFSPLPAPLSHDSCVEFNPCCSRHPGYCASTPFRAAPRRPLPALRWTTILPSLTCGLATGPLLSCPAYLWCVCRSRGAAAALLRDTRCFDSVVARACCKSQANLGHQTVSRAGRKRWRRAAPVCTAQFPCGTEAVTAQRQLQVCQALLLAGGNIEGQCMC